MNYEIVLKCRDFPLTIHEKAIIQVIASYTGKNSLSCFPSYETIIRQAHTSDSTIKDTIDLLRSVGILEYRNRANIMTGKESNSYTFQMENINYSKDGRYLIPNEEREKLNKRFIKERIKIKEARKKRAARRKKTLNSYKNTLSKQGGVKSQNLSTDVRNKANAINYSKTSSHVVNTLSAMGRSIEPEDSKTLVQSKISKESSNKENQKKVLQEEIQEPYSIDEQDYFLSDSFKKTEIDDSKATEIDQEWIDAYNNAP